MARSSKHTSWWDILLYGGLFLLLLVFFYQLLKLWQAGTAKVTDAGNAISQALANTVAAVTNGLTGLISNPFSIFSTLLNAFPDLLSLGLSFINQLFLGGLFAPFSWALQLVESLFSGFGNPAAITTGTGSSSPGSSSGAIAVVPGGVNNFGAAAATTGIYGNIDDLSGNSVEN